MFLVVSGNASLVVIAAAIAKTTVVSPSPGSPCMTVIFPNEIYGYHSQLISVASTSFIRISFNSSFLSAMKKISFAVWFIYIKSLSDHQFESRSIQIASDYRPQSLQERYPSEVCQGSRNFGFTCYTIVISIYFCNVYNTVNK